MQDRRFIHFLMEQYVPFVSHLLHVSSSSCSLADYPSDPPSFPTSQLFPFTHAHLPYSIFHQVTRPIVKGPGTLFGADRLAAHKVPDRFWVCIPLPAHFPMLLPNLFDTFTFWISSVSFTDLMLVIFDNSGKSYLCMKTATNLYSPSSILGGLPLLLLHRTHVLCFPSVQRRLLSTSNPFPSLSRHLLSPRLCHLLHA